MKPLWKVIIIAALLPWELLCLSQQPQEIAGNVGVMGIATTNSSLAASSNASGNRHYYRLDNLGASYLGWSESLTITNVTIISGATTSTVKNCDWLLPNGIYELPAGKIYNGPVSVITTNGTATYRFVPGVN